jgi:protein-serine/threonine kinase
MIPTPGKGVDAVNFRSLKESESVDISRSRSPGSGNGNGNGDVGERTEDLVDPFGEFNSGTSLHPSMVECCADTGLVTLHYDGDDYHADEHLLIRDPHRTAFVEA